MFNSQNLIGFIKRFLIEFILLTLLFLTLAFLTELFTNLNKWPGLLLTWQFWVAVAVNMLPAIVITIIVFFLASRFLKSVYGLEKRREGFDFLARSRFGQAGFSPFIKVDGGRRTLNADGILTKIGGPGSLIVFNDSAVVLEKAGKLTRVMGPGFHTRKLERLEKIYDIIDLRPKQWVYEVGAMTKEGIPVTWDVEVRYQIDDGGNSPTPEEPYPFSEEAVFKAATCKWRREVTRAQDMSWEGRVIIGATEGALRSILARRHLDELIGLTEADEEAVREVVQKQLEEAIREPASNFGARILQVKLANLQVRDSVTEEWIEAWRTRWQGWSQIRLGQGEADRVFLHETVKAEAQVQYIIQIARAFQEENINPGVVSPVLMMRFFSVLDKANANQLSEMREFFPNQAWQMTEQLSETGAGNDTAQQPEQQQLLEFPPPESRPPEPRPARSTSARIIPFRLPVIDEIAAGKARIVSDDIIDYIQVGQLEAEGQPVTVELLKGSQVALYPEYSYFAVKFPEDGLEAVDISADDCILLQKPKWSELEPEGDDIVAVLSREEGQSITLRQLEIDRKQDLSGEIVAIAIARLQPAEATAPDQPANQVDSVPVGIIPVINLMSAGKATPAPEDVTGYLYARQFEHGEQELKAEPLKGNEINFRPGNDYFIMRVSGDSMDQAGVAPGDYVILQKAASGSLKPATGDIVAVVFRDEDDDRATLKRLQIGSGQVSFKPESSNPEHKPSILPARAFRADNPQAEVVGIAVAVLKP